MEHPVGLPLFRVPGHVVRQEQAHHTAQHRPERFQGVILAAFAILQPGVRPAHDDAHQLAALLDVQLAQAQPDVAAVAAHGLRRQQHGAAVHAHFQKLHRVVRQLAARVAHPRPGHGNVHGARGQGVALHHVQGGRQIQVHAHRASHLAAFPRHGDGGEQNEQTEAAPEQVQGHDVRLHAVILMPEQPYHAPAQPGHEQERHHQVRFHRVHVEEGLVEQAALLGHVELAAPGVEEGHQGRLHQMEAQRRFVDLAPQGVPVPAVEPGVGIDGMEQVRQRVGQDHLRRGGDDVLADQQIGQRRRQEHHPRQREHEMQHGIQVTQPLGQGQAAPEQRVVQAHDLRHAPRPTRPLADVQRQPLGGQAGGQRQPQERRAPPFALHLQRRMGVLGHGFHGEAVHLVQGGPADHRAGAAEEGGVPEIVALLHRAVEQLALPGQTVTHRQIALVGVLGIEVVRGLQHGQPRIGAETAHGALQETGGGNVVAVEHADQLAVGEPHGVVQVAGLGVVVLLPGDVAHPGPGGEGGERLAATVVEQIDVHLVRRVLQLLGGQHRIHHHRQFLVVGGDVNVHGGPVRQVLRHRHDGPLQRMQRLDVTEEHDGPGVQLSDEQPVTQHVLKAGLEHQGLGDAPVKVAGGHHHGEQDQPQGSAPRARVAKPMGGNRQNRAGDAEHHLVLGIHGRGDEQKQRWNGEQNRQHKHDAPAKEAPPLLRNRRH